MIKKLSKKRKKTWITPGLTIYGTVEQITRGQGRPKVIGTQDDLHTHGKLS